ncbi:unnamed protein product [Dracunculus medinensis]|uniref:Ricin B-type lectin domain-containing protein n=1 Tax=Dracunculus medinensis TaxID=318479 RepID=A0A0N4UJZ6_DRAME|nr:unnamed protein product [Dracunculus medinensis]
MLMDVASQAITVHTLSKYRVDIADTANTSLVGSTSSSLWVSSNYPGSEQRYWLYHCGASNNSGRNGVAIVMSDKAHSALIEWKPVNDRMAYVLRVSSAISRS